MDEIGSMFIESATFRFQELKRLADKSMEQLGDDGLLWRMNPEMNSIAVLVQHLYGNMMSRWTDFLTSDGEKPTRHRDAEFEEADEIVRERLMEKWEEGWECLFSALAEISPSDLVREVAIRGQKLSVLDAISRQLTHYGYHVGQMALIAKQYRGGEWKTLSIPRGRSAEYLPTKRD